MIWMLSIALAAPPTHVVGGTPTEPGVWPTVTALYSGSGYACSGVLIAPDVVLTAGHCGRNLTHVRVGTTDSNSSDGELLNIASIHIYPRHLTQYDLAVLVLDGSATVPPSPLLSGCTTEYLVDGALTDVVGYGAIDRFGTSLDGLQREAVLPVVDADCDDANRGCNVAILPGGETIAGGDGVDSCNGDSGGPLFLTLAGTSYVAGIVSRAALPTSSACGDGGIYTRVDPVLDWIEEQAGVTLIDPDCSDIVPPNRPPVLVVEPVTDVVTAPITLNLQATDPDDDPVVLELIEPPLDGDVIIDGLNVTYTPALDVRGTDAFTLRLSDDAEPPGVSTATVTLSFDTVLPVEDTDVTEPEPEPGCACSTSPTPTPTLWAWFGVLAVFVRRVRASDASR